ncbi:MAG: MarR family transcriptional regulator [Chloroflexi bacterium]|nr:MarR family transcriptional regulator [Chloroflexota bacterium]MCC6894432.1 MarR family transcriptional regulator [Anaerolineae bacterium]
MDNRWSVHTLAEELMKLLPNLGKNITAHLRDINEEETTMMQVSVLYQIQEHSITASELAKRRRVSLQSASVLVQGLVEKGWIIRTPDPTDRRQFLLQITPEGLAKAETTRNQIITYLASFLVELTDEEAAAAQIFLPALNQILTQHMTVENTPEEKQRALQEE